MLSHSYYIFYYGINKINNHSLMNSGTNSLSVMYTELGNGSLIGHALVVLFYTNVMMMCTGTSK